MFSRLAPEVLASVMHDVCYPTKDTVISRAESMWHHTSRLPGAPYCRFNRIHCQAALKVLSKLFFSQIVRCRACCLTEGNHILHWSPCRYLRHHRPLNSRLRRAWLLFVPTYTNRYAAKCAYLSRSGDRHQQTLVIPRHNSGLSMWSSDNWGCFPTNLRAWYIENWHALCTEWLELLGNGRGKEQHDPHKRNSSFWDRSNSNAVVAAS